VNGREATNGTPTKSSAKLRVPLGGGALGTDNDIKMAKNTKSARETDGAFALLEAGDSESSGERARSFFRGVHSRNLCGDANSLLCKE
jgi:hypothetical protein